MSDETDADQVQVQVIARARVIAEQLAVGGARGNQVLWVLRRQGFRRQLQPARGPHYAWPVAGVTPPPGHPLAGRTLTVVLRNDGELRLAQSLEDGRLAIEDGAGRPDLPDAEVWQEIEQRLERLAREHHLDSA